MPEKQLLFDLGSYGHHPSYLRCIIEYFNQQSWDFELEIVVSRHFFQRHSDVVELAKKAQVNCIAITETEQEQFDTAKSKLGVKFFDLLQSQKSNSGFEIEFDLFRHYAEVLNVDHAIILYLDDGRLLNAAKADFPCPFSGIYFTPQFHYPKFPEHPPDKIRQAYYLQQKLIIARFLRHAQLDTLFCLDPFATEEMNRQNKTDKVVFLPDLVRKQKSEVSTITHLNIDTERQVFLLFGSLGKRKGIYEILQAILLLSPELCQQICLLVVGQAEPNTDINLLKSRVNLVREQKPVQIIEKYEFIPDQEVLSYFKLADVILTAYPRHAGMSGILFLAAISGKPVLSSNFGLMGEITRRYQLGLTVDAVVPKAIAEALQHCLKTAPESLCNYHKMQQLVEEHSPENFAQMLLNKYFKSK
ncbi:glycosyltransferase [Crocosphaera sp.]|uniref:glycosyltransferase n=1 Tax=Crocosphaera sp. TaxID=2729996 RepID=UPI0026269088|nr:glycosyltransferase [Crocosphaera sp.]MDJ0581313.1 glycosyltransferase [Crocosphaera sp.]